jgi:signal transduction histidine kinase
LTAAAVVFLLSLLTTVVIVAWPTLRFAYRARESHIALETTAALVALVAAFLVVGRFERRRRLDDLLLAVALVLFALTNLVFLAVPAMFSQHPPGRFSVWTALAGAVFGAVAFALAAYGAPRRVGHRHATALTILLAAGLVAITAAAVALLETRLPTGVEAELRPEASDRPRLVGHPAVLGVQLLTTTLFALAAVGFARRSDREGDPFLGWLAAASVLAAFARLNYFLYPSLYTEWIYSGDAFRLLFYAMVLVAAAREIASYWQAAAEAAVLEERRRVARDLHDGLAQELAYIGRSLRRLDQEDAAVMHARAGTQRALAESRLAIAALTEPLDRPLDAALRDAVHDVAAREDTQVVLTVDRDVRSTLAEREALVRIACEATTNAARHGRAPLVHVRLEREGRGLRMVIADRGAGFDPGQSGRGFGLISMRERACAVGGRFRVSSTPGRGTEVEVDL